MSISSTSSSTNICMAMTFWSLQLNFLYSDFRRGDWWVWKTQHILEGCSKKNITKTTDYYTYIFTGFSYLHMLLWQMSAKKNRVSRFLELALPNYPTSYKMLHPWTKSVKKVLRAESKTSVYQSKANLKKSDFKAKSTFAHVNLQKTFSTKLSINVKWSVRRVSPSGGLISSLLTRCSILHSIYFVLKFMITLTVILFGNLIQLL